LSSILKALKKIEGDSPPPQTYPTLAKPIDSERALNSNVRKRRRWRRISYFSIFLLIVAVGTVMLFSQRRLIIAKVLSVVSPEAPTAAETSNPDQFNVYRAKVPPASAKPAKMPPARTRQPKNQTPGAASEIISKKYQAATSSDSRRLTGRTSVPQPTAGRREPEAALKSRIKKPLPEAPPPLGSRSDPKTAARKNTRPAAPAARTEKPVQTRRQPTYDRFNDSNLKLQALAWSDDAARRMVVINGLIIHEGESVEGYQIVKIRQEDVIVKQGGKSWRLEFGLQQ
jgi:hypothetical protein